MTGVADREAAAVREPLKVTVQCLRFVYTALEGLGGSQLACCAATGSGGRAAEGGGLLNRYRGENLYRGFESLPLREQQAHR
jgi:hypothetical protein